MALKPEFKKLPIPRRRDFNMRVLGVATPSEKRQSEWARNALGALIGVVLTVGVGDLLVKRNYEAAVAEGKGVDLAILSAKEEFSNLSREVSELIRDRRAAIQRLSVYAADGNPSKFADYYDSTYATTLTNWNAEASNLAERVRSVTACRGRTDDSPVASAITASVYNSRSDINAKAAPADSALMEDSKLTFPNGKYCPDGFLFSTREEAVLRKSNEPFSVYEAFRLLHTMLLESRLSDTVTCSLAADALRNEALGRCGFSSVRFLGKDYAITPTTCLRATATVYASNKLCPAGLYQKLNSFKAQWFDTIDHRWRMGLAILNLYRSDYIRRRCEGAAGFWTGIFRREICTSV